MVIFVLLIVWVSLASTPAHYLLAVLATFARVIYVSGDSPTKPFAFLPIWLIAFLFSYLVMSSDEDAFVEIAMVFLKILILGTLSLHLILQPGTQRIAYRIPYLRSFLMLVTRGVTVLRRVVSDMNFTMTQAVASERDSSTGRGIHVRLSRVSIAYVVGSYRIASSFLQEGMRLNERWTSVVASRGGFPTDRFSYVPMSVRVQRRAWYSNALGDILISALIVIPIVMDDAVLVPERILEFAQAVRGLVD